MSGHTVEWVLSRGSNRWCGAIGAPSRSLPRARSLSPSSVSRPPPLSRLRGTVVPDRTASSSSSRLAALGSSRKGFSARWRRPPLPQPSLPWRLRGKGRGGESAVRARCLLLSGSPGEAFPCAPAGSPLAALRLRLLCFEEGRSKASPYQGLLRLPSLLPPFTQPGPQPSGLREVTGFHSHYCELFRLLLQTDCVQWGEREGRLCCNMPASVCSLHPVATYTAPQVWWRRHTHAHTQTCLQDLLHTWRPFGLVCHALVLRLLRESLQNSSLKRGPGLVFQVTS